MLNLKKKIHITVFSSSASCLCLFHPFLFICCKSEKVVLEAKSMFELCLLEQISIHAVEADHRLAVCVGDL
jgi:hypothetical protein